MKKELEEGTYSLDNKTVAYKDGVCYPLKVSNETVIFGMFIGKFRVLTIDNEIVAKFEPMLTFSNGYKLLYIDNIENDRKIVNAYDKLLKNNKY